MRFFATQDGSSGLLSHSAKKQSYNFLKTLKKVSITHFQILKLSIEERGTRSTGKVRPQIVFCLEECFCCERGVNGCD